jgi:GNAT superfamily N-acetyltransferase
MGTPLTTGWEPDLAPGDSLLRRFLLGYADRTAEMAQRVGGRAERGTDAALADLGSPFPYDNAVVLLRPPTEAGLAAVLDRAAAFYPADRAWIVLSAWSLPDLSGRGLGLVGHPPLMLRPDGRASAGPYPAELRIQPVTTAADLAVFGRVLVDGYPLDGDPGVIADPRLLGGSLFLFVGYAGSTPVAASGAYLHHGLIEVDWVATLPQARGRGYGRALTWRALQVAPDAPAMLLASDPGRPVYEGMGFLPLLRMTMWVREPRTG